MKLLSLPRLHQTFDYDCGANALQTVLVYYGVEAYEDEIMVKAGTKKNGTAVKGLLKVVAKDGLKYDARQMTIDDIKKYIDKKIPVILVLQAWADDAHIDWESDWSDGHYVVAIGYTKEKVVFQDPASFEHTYLKYDELLKRWHDADSRKGKKYVHFGIAIYGKKPVFREDTLVHMD